MNNVNRKRIGIIIFLVLLMALSVTFASCEIFNHKHAYGNKWASDGTRHWKECSCGDKQHIGFHVVSDWTVDREATETTKGSRYGICDVCQKIVTQEIDFAAAHVHNFDVDWSCDNSQHWKECSCGEKTDIYPHDVSDWIIDKPATEDFGGKSHGECETCGQTVTKDTPPIGHVHNFDVDWSFNNSQHWKECSCGAAEIDRASHQTESWTVEKDATTTEEGLKSAICSVCNNKITQIIPVITEHTHSFGNIWTTDNDNHWHECSCGEKSDLGAHTKQWITDVPATTTSSGSKHQECVTCHKTFQTETIPQLTSVTRTVDFYSINDFHGAVDKMSRIGGYLSAQQNNNANTVLLNSGDMFQGSIASNSNRGKLLSDCMAEIGFAEITFGNHEFDWGLDNLRNLSKSSGVPFLGANIYNWNANKHTWGDFADDLARKYIIKTLDNGLKVGIIGVIGEDQITSISSNLVQSIGFKNPLDVVPDIATELRNQYSCDVVVLSAHVGPQGLVGESEQNEEPSTAGGLEQYVDAVFCAHTHREQSYVVDGLPFIQGGSSGENISHIQLSVDANGNVTCKAQNNIGYSNSWNKHSAVDNLINESYSKIEEEANENLGYISQSLNSSPQLSRLACRAISEFAIAQGHDDIVLAMTNQARATLPAGYITYENLYKSLPFDNIIYIAEVSGFELLKEADYSTTAVWRVSGEAIERSENKFYKIAIIDYMLFHQNTNRYYNYFSSAFENGRQPVALTPADNPMYNYREITRDYLRNHDINASDYTINNNFNNTSLLTESVTLDSSGSGGNTETVKGTGTRNDPYTVKDALLLAATATEASGSPSGYVKGTVKSIATKLAATSGDMQGLYIEDDQGNSIQVFYLKKYQGASVSNNWSNVNEIKVGDELLIYANSIYTYNSRTPEIYNSYCVTINGNAPD